MIVVTGTRRSGTSMWMQVLKAAGLPALGEAFPRNWSGALRDANPAGFWESRLRKGINYHTNPDPETGEYLHPIETRPLAVKVFLPGLVNSDIAFLDRVVITVRDWREYAVSVQRLEALERGRDEPAADAGPTLGPALEWWVENWSGLRDLFTRRYACHVLSYATMIDRPLDTVTETLQWLDGLSTPELDAEAAAAVVTPDLYTRRTPGPPQGIDERYVQVFDELYRRVHEGHPFDRAFLEELNDVNRSLTPLVHELYREARLHREFEGSQEPEP